MWTKETLEKWKVANGKTWREIARDLGTKERYLRAIRAGEKKGLPLLERAEKIERRISLRQSVDALKEKKGVPQKEIAREMGVGERHLRKMLSDTEKEPKEGIPTVYKIFREVKREGLEDKVPGVKFFLDELGVERIGKILGEMFDSQFRGRRKKDNAILAKELFEREKLDERLEAETWRVARDVYDEIMGVPIVVNGGIK